MILAGITKVEADRNADYDEHSSEDGEDISKRHDDEEKRGGERDDEISDGSGVSEESYEIRVRFVDMLEEITLARDLDEGHADHGDEGGEQEGDEVTFEKRNHHDGGSRDDESGQEELLLAEALVGEVADGNGEEDARKEHDDQDDADLAPGKADMLVKKEREIDDDERDEGTKEYGRSEDGPDFLVGEKSSNRLSRRNAVVVGIAIVSEAEEEDEEGKQEKYGREEIYLPVFAVFQDDADEKRSDEKSERREREERSADFSRLAVSRIFLDERVHGKGDGAGNGLVGDEEEKYDDGSGEGGEFEARQCEEKDHEEREGIISERRKDLRHEEEGGGGENRAGRVQKTNRLLAGICREVCGIDINGKRDAE